MNRRFIKDSIKSIYLRYQLKRNRKVEIDKISESRRKKIYSDVEKRSLSYASHYEDWGGRKGCR